MSPFDKQDESSITSVPPEVTFMDVFDRVDVSGNGLLCRVGVEEAVREIWPEFNDEESMISRAYVATDLNGDGYIGRDEFALFLHFLSHYNTMRHYCEGSGSELLISKGCFTTALSHLSGVGDSEETFDMMDGSKEGFLLLDEVCLLMALRSANGVQAEESCYRVANSGSSRLLFNPLSCEQRQTRINRVFLDLKKSMELLHLKVSGERIESWAILMNSCMSASHHSYHNVRRIFDVSDGADPLQVLAACFYGCIRYEFFGLAPEAAKLLEGVVHMKDGDVICLKRDFLNAPHDAMVLDIFGFVPGQKLTYRCGKNKFLCALLAARALKDKVPLTHLTKIAVCLQATNIAHVLEVQNSVIMLAQASQSGKSETENSGETHEHNSHSLDQLYDRLVQVNETFGLNLTKCTMTRAVQRAADFANRNYRGYVMSDSGKVVDLMWAWLSQVNPALRERKLYTVNDYHLGVKMAAQVWTQIDLEKIFTSFLGVPDQTEVNCLIRRARRNKEIGIEHSNAHIVSLALLAALAILTGGNAPISFFVGDHPTERICSDQLGECLPKPSERDLAGCDMRVYEILAAKGGRTDAAFDMGMSLVTAFVYGKLGTKGIRSALKLSDYPMDAGKAKKLVQSLPLDVVVPIGKEIARIAITRTECFGQLLRDLSSGVNGDS